MEKKIEELCVSSDSIRILKQNKINYISQLNNKTEEDLKNMGITQKEISIIAIKIKFDGFQLKPNPEISKEINKMLTEALDEFLEEGKKSL